jgi:hypothetical protein
MDPWKPSRSTWTRLTLVLAVMTAINLTFPWGARRQIAAGGNDFMHLYSAGRMTRTGQGAELFDLDRQLEVQREVSDYVRSVGEAYPYMRPPFASLPYVPYSLFPLVTGYLLWSLTSLALLAVFVSLIRRRLPALREIPLGFWVLALPAFFPVVVVLTQGQDEAVMLLLVTLAFLKLRDGRELSAGAWLGLTLFRPQYALPLACLVALGGHWGVLGGFALVAAVLGAVTAAVYGWPMLIEYPQHLLGTERVLNDAGALMPHMPSLHGLASVLLHPAPGLAVLSAVIGGSVVVFAWAVWFYRRHRIDAPAIAFSAALIATILVSYHAFVHGLTLLFLPVVLQLEWLLTRPQRPVTRWLLWLPTVPLLLSPLGILMLRGGQLHLYPVALLAWLAGAALAGRDAVSERRGR